MDGLMKTAQAGASSPAVEKASTYPLMQALLTRRSRRFGKGMHLDGGPLSFASEQQPQPLSLEEEAILAFAACGVTGYGLAELPFQNGEQPETGRRQRRSSASRRRSATGGCAAPVPSRRRPPRSS